MTTNIFLLRRDGSICSSFSSRATEYTHIHEIAPEIAPDVDWASLLHRGEHRIFFSLPTTLGEKGQAWRLEFFPLEGKEEDNPEACFCCIFSSQEERKIDGLQDELANLQHIIDAMPFGVAVIRRDKHVHLMNRAALDLAGYENFEKFKALGKPCQETFCPAPEGKCPVWDLGNLFDKTERPFLLRDGSEIRVLKSAVPVEIQGETMMLEGIIDLRKEKELERMARTDPLTGLLNRKGMEEHLQEYYDRAVRGETDFTLLMIDLDNFKKVNDRYGHFVGDKVLRHFGRMVKDCLGEGDLVARWGGDEFLVMTLSSEEKAMALGKRIITSTEANCLLEPHEENPLSLSFGAASYSPGVALQDLLEEADAFMYGEKRKGGGCDGNGTQRKTGERAKEEKRTDPL
jgi:diguanylate cyclase (GGDEF)-like protein